MDSKIVKFANEERLMNGMPYIDNGHDENFQSSSSNFRAFLFARNGIFVFICLKIFLLSLRLILMRNRIYFFFSFSCLSLQIIFFHSRD